MHRFRFGKRIPDEVLATIRKDIERVEKLLADLEAVCDNPFPLEKWLAKSYPNAPILDEWQVAFRPTLCLQGRVTGHPELPGDGRKIVTSQISILSDEYTWARSLSRFYHLGRPCSFRKDS